MPHDDEYQLWKKARTAIRVPEGFTDRVMASIRRYEGERRTAVVAAYFGAILASRWGKIAVCSAAGAACLIRIGSLLSVFFVY